MEDCIFCKIANGSPDNLILQNDVAAAFFDISPKAPVHALVVPRAHIKNLDALDDEKLAGQLIMTTREVIKKLGLVEANKIMMSGIDIDHLHIHIMSDRRYHGPKLPAK
jgi:histidine triad (HIT) family protein